MVTAIRAAWTWALGELRPPEKILKDDLLLQLVGVATCLAMYGGLKKAINGAEMLRGAWLAGMHGGIPLSAVIAWWLWRTREQVGVVPCFAAVSGAALVALPTVARLSHRSTIMALKPFELPICFGVIAGFGLLFFAARQARMPLNDFGLGLGDWRWWLPRLVLGLLIISVGVAIAISTFDDLARYYPRVNAARHDFGVLMQSMLGMFMGIFGWEMLFRGVLLWVFARRGDIKGAIEANAIIFFLGHIDKPVSELALSLPGGIIACWFGWRAGSFVPVWLLHAFQLFAINFAGYLIHR